MGSLKQNFYNANHAFNFLWDHIVDNGIEFDNTKAIFNCGFYMHLPKENTIDVEFRNWSNEYAEYKVILSNLANNSGFKIWIQVYTDATSGNTGTLQT